MITAGAVSFFLALLIVDGCVPHWVTRTLLIGFTYGLIFWT